MPVLENIRRNIRHLLPDREQTAFARRIGMPGSLLSNYLNGDKDPGIVQIERIAIGLGVTVASLLGEETPIAPAQSLEKLRLTCIAAILRADGPEIETILDALKPLLNGSAKKSKGRSSIA